MGTRKRCDALLSLVSAPHRTDCGKARRFPYFWRRWSADRAFFGLAADPERTGRFKLSVRRHAGNVRGARLHRVGPVQPDLHNGRAKRKDTLYPLRLYLVLWPGARQEDPIASFDGVSERAGAEGAQALWQYN